MTMTSSGRFDLRDSEPMNRIEERRCASAYVKGRDPLLAKRLICANLRLVVKIARGYSRAHCDMRDLVQEGNLGLIQAVERFDPERGGKLSSYAGWWIRAYILKYTIENWRLVKTGTTQAQRRLFFSLQKEQRKLEARGTAANTKEIAATLQVKEAEVTAMIERFSSGETSFDAPSKSGSRDGRTLGGSLSASSSLRPDVRVEDADFQLRLQESLKAFGQSLHGRERDIYRRRLLNEDPATLVTLATRFGVTRERARQLEWRLKQRIRLHLVQDLGDAVQAEARAA